MKKPLHMIITSAKTTHTSSDMPTNLAYRPHLEQIISAIIAPISACLVANLLRHQWSTIKGWRPLPWTRWLVFLIYFCSFLFIFGSWTFQLWLIAKFHMGSLPCQNAGIVCISAYVAIKLVYLFMIDKVHVIRGTVKTRLKSKLYAGNLFAIIGVYGIILIFNFIFHISQSNRKPKSCNVRLESITLLPVIAFDAIVNIYLTSLFLVPLLSLYSVQGSIMKPWMMDETTHHQARAPPNSRLRRLALRTFVGALGTLICSIVNLSVLLGLGGEAIWVCLAGCNTDIFFTAFVIHWVNSSGKQLPRPSIEAVLAAPHLSLEMIEK